MTPSLKKIKFYATQPSDYFDVIFGDFDWKLMDNFIAGDLANLPKDTHTENQEAFISGAKLEFLELKSP